ncbi:HNH endonuclease [Acinetobacter towneri]|uniref:two-partner secretion domain-containing protein n=1 Tax=Acinetobacter towneri TaxID=202956 RepID=UPI001AA09E67|nr:hemagglutinin repeat-containing protein [Acinetobacter towneri]QTD65189.1 HNH endonuclease [Acinetobacter towneri]
MNKNRYRVIYSQARGVFVAVAEIVKSRTKATGQNHSNAIPTLDISEASVYTYKKLNPLNFAVISLLGAVVYSMPLESIANTQIIADKTAPTSQQATILNSSNGITQVNIQTPSAGGVSRNTYSQFDVGVEGAILNNSRNNVQTQLGGWVQGNPWLAKGEAKVILNEVNSSNPSQLKGYLEVAGKSAQVVIANPSGLVCDGCGVINADRFTLSTGQAVVNQGYLESFRVREGQVTLEGKGLNGSLTPYTDIYTRALNVNAGLYANNLNVALGQNDINVKDQTTPQINAASSNLNTNPNKPNFTLDVGQLGGMYAGKIFLVGTENGLGVRNAGSINATTGQMTLNAHGDLINTGNIIANKDQISIQAHNVKNSGNISSTQSKIQLDATDIQNSGLIATSDELKLNAQGNINNNDGVINAGRIDFTAENLSNDQGKIEQSGQQQLNIQAKKIDNSKGRVGQATKDNIGAGQSSGGVTSPTVTDPEQQSSAQDSSTVEVAPVELTPKTFQAGHIQIAEDISNVEGKILNNADIHLDVQDNIKNNAGEIQLPELQFNGQNFENQDGKFTANVVNLTANNVDNQKGSIIALDRFDLNAVQLNNSQGRLQSSQTLNLTSTQLDNSEGQIVAGHQFNLTATQTNNNKGIIASIDSDAVLHVDHLNNTEGQISAQRVELVGQQLNNQQGSIQAKSADLNLNVAQIDNGMDTSSAGNIIAAKNLKLTAQQLTSTGQIYAGDTADLTVKQLQQDGQLAALNKINVHADHISSNQNAVWAAGLDTSGTLSNADVTLDIKAQQAQIAGKILSGTELQIQADKQVDLSHSESQAKHIKIQTQQLKTESAQLIADQQLDLNATQNIDNQQGQYSAVQVNIQTQALNNDQGLIQHTGQDDFKLDIADRIDNNAGQIISNAAHTEIKTTTLNSVEGAILHAGDQQLSITAQNLQGQKGTIQSNRKLQLELGATNLDNATTIAQNINLNAKSLSHQQGQLIQSDDNGQLSVNVEQVLDNTSGMISAAGHTTLQTADLNNQQGVIQTLTGKDLTITSQKFSNQSGKIIAGRDANLHVSELNNDTGTVYADGQLDVAAVQAINNQQGLIASQQTLTLKGQTLNNQKGQIQSVLGDVNLNLSQDLNNQSGNIQSAQALKIQSPNLNNKNGQLISGAESQLNVAELNNQAGTIYSKKQLDVTVSGTADNSAGTVAAEQNLNLNAQRLLNEIGQIRSENADTTLNVVQNIANNTGLISAGKNLNLTAQDVLSQKGKLQSGANTQIKVSHLDNSEGVVYAAEQLQLSATGELNNSQGVVAAEQLVDLKVGSVINDAGQIRSQQDQLKLNIENELSNLAGEISASKAIELTANTLSNQNGKVISGASLNASTQQLDNHTGTIYAKDQVNLTVADQLNNQSGTIAANQQVQIQADNLNNNAGKIRSEQNQLDLNAQQTLDNQSGEIFAGTHANINATMLTNQQGTIYAKNQLDLKAGQLNNQQGQVYSAGSANVTAQGNVQNQKGVLAAGENLNINSAGLDNTEGTLRSEKADLTLNTQGQLINQDGDIYAGQNASLNTKGLINQAGQIAAQNQLSIDTQQQQLSNQNAKIIAKTVDLQTGLLDNQAGLIQGEQSVKVDTHNQALLNNNSGDQAGILSQGSLEIANVAQLDNISGYIAAVGSAHITAQNTNNNKGQINSQADLHIQQQASGGRIDNVAGQIQAQQNVNLNADTINNTGVGSHIVAGEKLTATAHQVINAQTKDTTVIAGLDAQNIEINAVELDNQSGVIRATDQANLNLSNQLNNQLGSISSLDTLNIGTPNKTLNVNNIGGELLTKNQLNLNANELVNKGKIISEGNVAIDLKQSYTHTQDDQIAANGTLKLNTENNLINQSELTAGQKLELSAKNIKNEAGASISSNETHLTAQDTIHNQGLINGELTHLQANRVWNDGARIYGTHVAIQANTLDNKSNVAGIGAVIASRGDMDLGIQTLNNQSGGEVKLNARDNAWIFSAGDLNVGGNLDTKLKANGRANHIYNGSAVIESLGNMILVSQAILNNNERFKTSMHEVGRKDIHTFEINGKVYNADEIVIHRGDRGLLNFEIPNEGTYQDAIETKYTEVTKQKKIDESVAAQILSAKNLIIQSQDIRNEQSQMLAAQVFDSQGVDIKNNNKEDGYQIVKAVNGAKIRHYQKKEKTNAVGNHKMFGKIENLAFSVPDATTYPDIDPSDHGGNRTIKHHQTSITNTQTFTENLDINSASETNITSRNQQAKNKEIEADSGEQISVDTNNTYKSDQTNNLKINNSAINSIDAEQSQTNQLDIAQQLQSNPQNLHVQSNQTQTEIRTVNQEYLTLPSNALYITTAKSQAKYFVETDPAFANYKNWLSSDYMLKALGLDPVMQQKRIGDGYYEQRLIHDQIAQLTGYRFLAGYSSDEEQYKALMNNGLTFAKLYNLRPGVALTDAQIAQLTTDIVWLEEKTIKLTDGTITQAWFPQVYVRAQVGDLKGDGSLISANQVNIKMSGDVLNSTTIAGREVVNISANNINQLNGRIESNQLALKTQKDLNNIGGKISARSSAILDIARDFNHRSTTYDAQNIDGENVFIRQGIDRKAALYVGGPLNVNGINTEHLTTTLTIRVGGDVRLDAAGISNNNGNTQLHAAGNLSLNAEKSRQLDQSVNSADNYHKREEARDIGSSITGLGNVNLNANQISGKAINIESKTGDLALVAQNGITLENGESRASVDQGLSVKTKALIGSKAEKTKEQWNTSESIANQLKAGGNIILDTQQGDITATHLKAQAGENIQIHAQQGNVTLNSAIDENSHSSTSEKKNFATYNNRQTGYIDQNVAQTQLTAGKNVDINARKNIELQANDVQAGQSIYVGNTLMQRQADGTLKAVDGSLMPENVKLSTLEIHDQQWNETQKGYRGIVKDIVKVTAVGLAGIEALAPGLKAPKITVSESESKRTEQINQTGSSLKADNVYIGSSGQTTLTSTDLSAKNTVISGQKVTLNAAEEQKVTVESQSKETVEGLGVKLNKDNIRLGGFVLEDTSQSSKTTETTHKVGSINTENLKIQGADGVDILGQNITATGDTVIDHGRGNLNIGGYENKTTVEDKSHVETISTEVGVRNAYLDAALAVGAVKDAAEAVKQAKDAYSQAQRDYASGKITKDALNDSKVNVAMASANLASAQIAVGAAAATAAASSATYGFTIGANGERIETTTTTNTTQGKWQGSQLELNNLTLKSDNQDVNVQGSRLTATGTTTFDGTKDFNVTAGIEHGSQDSSSKTNSQSVSYTYGGGGSVSVGKQTSKSHDESLTNVNSDVELNKVSGAINTLNIQGGEVSIQDRGTLQVNNIHVESLQDTATSSNSSKGGNIGVGFGSNGKASNISASYNQGKGSSDSAWVNDTSKLLIGSAQNDADLDEMGVKNVTNIGGVIANATKNSDGTQTDHGKLNYSGELELKDIKDHNYNSSSGFNVSTSIGIPQKGTKEASTAPKGSTTIGLNSSGQETEQLTKATLGQGTVTNVTDTTNRDINNTQEITRDQTTGMLDGSVTVDHRLLTENGRAEIIQQQKDIPENFRQSAENLAKALPEGVYKDNALQTLNNIQAKLYNLPPEYKEAGELGNEVVLGLIRRGVEPKEIDKLFDDNKAGLLTTLEILNDKNKTLELLKSQGLTLNQILSTAVGKEIQDNVISFKDYDVEVMTKETLGMSLLSTVNFLGNSITDISKETGVDPATVQLAIGLLLNGPVKLVGDLAMSSLVDTVVGEKIKEAKSSLAISMTAASRLTDSDTVNKFLDPESIYEIESSNKDDFEFIASGMADEKQGAEYLIDVAAGVIGVGVGKGIAKGKDSDINNRSAQDQNSLESVNNSREELTKPYDSNQTRKNLEEVHGTENIKSTTVPPYDAKNVKLAGERHPITGVVFDKKGYPIFDDIARYDTNLVNKGFNKLTYKEQMQAASKDLWHSIERGEIKSSQFTAKQLKQIENGKAKIDGFTWHHHQDQGRMQLVPEWEHAKTGHIGGDAMKSGK